MRRCLVRLEHIMDVGIDSSIVTLSCALVHIAVLFDQAAPDRPYAYAYARLVPHLTYGLYHISGFGGVCLSDISDTTFAIEGP